MYKGGESLILVLSQRDIKHPLSGGAEKYMHHAMKKLAENEQIVHVSVGHANLKEQEIIDGIQYVRKGRNLISLIGHGMLYYLRHRGRVRLVIDHANTHQFFSFLWARSKRVFFIHQLTQEIWTDFYGKRLGRLLSWMEDVLLRLSRGVTITVSESTRNDLLQRGFRNVMICPEGNAPKYLTLPNTAKEDYLVYAGRLVPYKRVEDAIRLAAHVGKKLCIVGRGQPAYEKQLQELVKDLQADCEMLGYLPAEQKDKLIEHAHLFIMPSIREGWGLVITESANLGTPSLVYQAPGVIEAVDYGRAGYIAPETCWESMEEVFREITPEKYERMRQSAFDYSLRFSWDHTADVFASQIRQILNRQVHQAWKEAEQ